MTFWCGSGSGSAGPYDLQDANKKLFFYNFFTYSFLTVHLHHFSKIKGQKELQNSRKQGFSTNFWSVSWAGAGSGSGSLSLSNGSGPGSGRPKKHVGPVDPDPQHWLRLFQESLLNSRQKQNEFPRPLLYGLTKTPCNLICTYIASNTVGIEAMSGTFLYDLTDIFSLTWKSHCYSNFV